MQGYVRSLKNVISFTIKSNDSFVFLSKYYCVVLHAISYPTREVQYINRYDSTLAKSLGNFHVKTKPKAVVIAETAKVWKSRGGEFWQDV